MSVIRVYAKALFVAAEELKFSGHDFDHLEDQLKTLGEMLKRLQAMDPAFFHLFMTPAITVQMSREEIDRFIDSIVHSLKLTPLVKKLFVLLIQQRRLKVYQQIVDAFHGLRLLQQNILLGHCFLATSLSSAESELVKKELEKMMSQRLGKAVILQMQVDPSLIAGIKVVIDGMTYDGSLQLQLQVVRKQLMSQCLLN